MKLHLKLVGVFAGVLLLWLGRPISAVKAQDEAEAAPGEAVCPLSEEQTQKSIQAFAALAPIFHEDRCINCHGDVDPFAEDGGHEGGQIKEVQTDGAVDTEATFQQCQKCHDAFPGWMTAPEPVQFVGKDNTALCKQMRHFFRRSTGSDSFMGHMKFDNGNTQFIGVAFEGTKGMSKPDKVEKPKMTRPEMIQLSQAWVDAMGGRFHGDDSCGCEPQHYALQLNYQMFINLSALPLISGEYTTKTLGQSQHGLEIPLTFTAPNTVEGQGVMELGGKGQIAAPIGVCTGQSQQLFLVRATAKLEEGDELSKGANNKLHFKLECNQMHVQSSGNCPYQGGSESHFSQCADDVNVDLAPASVDSSRDTAFPAPLPGSQATLTTTIVKKQ